MTAPPRPARPSQAPSAPIEHGPTRPLSAPRPDRAAVAADLASGDVSADLLALLGRWSEPGRPAVLVALDWEPPFAEVYPEDELIAAFPDAPAVPAGPIGGPGPGRLLVVVIDEAGETAYVIPDPRAMN